jgi:DNA-binding CsgD family transcriptional regulator
MTRREKEICYLLSDETVLHSNKELAFRMGLSLGTIKLYVSKLTRRLGVDRVGLALLGVRMRKAGCQEQLGLDFPGTVPVESLRVSP